MTNPKPFIDWLYGRNWDYWKDKKRSKNITLDDKIKVIRQYNDYAEWVMSATTNRSEEHIDELYDMVIKAKHEERRECIIIYGSLILLIVLLVILIFSYTQTSPEIFSYTTDNTKHAIVITKHRI